MGGSGSRLKKWCRCNGSCCCGCLGSNKMSGTLAKEKDIVHLNPMTHAPITVGDETDSESRDVLIVQVVDFCAEENAQAHNTNKFEAVYRDESNGYPSLIVRRGQTFRVKIAFNRPFKNLKDSISFIFTFKDDQKPNRGHNTLIGTTLKFDYFDVGAATEWGCAIDAQHGDILEVLVKPAANAPVGEWRMDIDTQLINGSAARSFRSPATFFVLFNAWCRDDQVYLSGNSEREEYILDDSTLIWRGSYNRLQPSVWKLGQYEKNVLECSLLLIEKIGKISPAFRGDPVKISRALSAAVNSPDDDGAVLGNWGENFTGGTAPTKWVGSTAILQQYFKKRKPVKFGQCWIFAGVLSTIARAIGIPSRIVTCYSCAHDTQASLTIDYFVDDTGRLMEEMNSDSLWNFHVWNELWMDRLDLGMNNGSYGGWQVVDATPQEMSDGIYRCGPAPVRAIKLGEILRPYDCNFVYAEVNADKVVWRYAGPSQPLKLLRKDTLTVGVMLSTKAVGQWEREDITNFYKFPEKSRDERDTMHKALRQTDSAFARFYLNEEFNDVYFDFELLDDIKIGENFFVVLQIKNRSADQPYKVTGTLNVDAVLYTGKKRDNIKSNEFNRELPPNTIEFIRMEVTFDEYFTKLLDQAAFNISCMATVVGTNFDYFAQDDFRVRKPDIKIKLQGRPVVDRELDVIVRLTNPLPLPLRKAVFQLEGPGIDKQLVFKVADVPISGTTSATFKYVPPYSGRSSFLAKFSSKELDDVDGYLAFEVEPRPEDVLIRNGHHPSSNWDVRTNIIH